MDASAILAWFRLEPGALVVETALVNVAAISVVNWAEALSKLADLGHGPDEVRHGLESKGVLRNGLLLWPMDEAAAMEIARLRSATRSYGLSLGDRACLALGRHLRLPVLTADRAWKSLRLGVQIHVIR
jgi:PIN domain nuclease of toxin-antitoxin system